HRPVDRRVQRLGAARELLSQQPGHRRERGPELREHGLMPITYTTPVNPYVGNVGELMERAGTIEAQRAREVANANAAATVAGGNAWGGAVRDIGATVGGQLMKVGERMADPAYQLEKEQVTRLQRENKSRNVFEAELRNPANYNEDGTVNDAAITTRLKK